MLLHLPAKWKHSLRYGWLFAFGR